MVYFPEPSRPDETWPGWDETAVEWFRRSSQPRARAVREFLNRNLAYFPTKHAKSLPPKLNQDWQSFFFEIVVGRYLQVLGAEVEHEPLGSNGTHIDYRATFPDGVVSVECVSKRFNLKAQRTMQQQRKMAAMLDGVGPTKWAIQLNELPVCNSPDEFRPYVDRARHFYDTLPEPVETGPRFEFEWEGDGGRMAIEAIPFPDGTVPNHLGPGVLYMDDSMLRLKDALIDSHKRKQARGAIRPVFLAIDCPFGGPDADDFDEALFGQTVQHMDIDARTIVGYSFNSNGLLVTDKDIPFAGVIAFLNMSMVGAADPVLYLNPYQPSRLPSGIAGHEQRRWTAGIDAIPAAREPPINSIGFVSYDQAD